MALLIFKLVKPFKTKSELQVEVFNEIVSICHIYLVMCMSDFVVDLETRMIVGHASCALIQFHLLVSISRILRSTVLHLCRSYQRKSALRRFKEQQQAKMTQLSQAIVKSRKYRQEFWEATKAVMTHFSQSFSSEED